MIEKIEKLGPVARRIVTCLFAMITIVLTVVLLSQMNSGVQPDKQIQLDEGWTVTINDQTSENVSLSLFSFPVLQKGEKASLSIVLPESAPYATIRLWMCHSAIDAYLDGELFYSYGHEMLSAGKMIGSGFFFIELPTGYAGKTLTLEFDCGETDAYSSFESIYIEGSDTVYNSFLHEKFMPLLSGIFLLVVGLAGLCLCAFAIVGFIQLKRLAYVFAFATCVGVWTLCNNGLTQLVCSNMVYPQAMEFISLYLAPIPVLGFMLDLNKDKENLYRINKILIAIYVVYNTIAFSICAVGITHFQFFLKPYHVCLGSTILVVGWTVIHNFRQKENRDMYVFVGATAIVVGCIWDLGSFYFYKYFKMESYSFKYGTIVGSILLVMCLFSSYFSDIRKQITAGTENKLLEKLAYHDILTGAINRVKFEEQLDAIDEAKEPYAIMYFDLNGLKYTNDTYGHQAGDALIKEFVICLATAFQRYGEVARLGGDEFAVILPKCGKKEIIDLVKKLQISMRQHNEHSQFMLDTAFGVAFSIEAYDGKSRTVCKMADARMYAMKRQMKQNQNVKQG